MINLICVTREDWIALYSSIPAQQRFSSPADYVPKLMDFGKPVLVKIGRVDAHAYPPQNNDVDISQTLMD